MRLRLLAGRGPVFGISLSDAAFCAIAVGRGDDDGPRLVVPFTDWRSELPTAFEKLRETCEVTPAAHVALLGSVCVTKDVRLPPMSDADRVRLLSRSGARYLPLPPGPLAIRCVERGPANVVRVDAVSEADFEVIHRAAARAGVRVASVVPGREALALALWRSIGPRRTLLLTATSRWTESLVVERGRVLEVRRRLGSDPGTLLKETRTNEDGAQGSGPVERVLVATDWTTSDQLGGSPAGVEAGSAPLGSGFDAPRAAAAFAPHVPTAIAPQRQRDEGHRARVRWAATRVALAVLVLVLSQLTEWWGAARELSHARAERARIQEGVAATFDLRRKMERVEGSLADIRAVEEESPDWARILSTIALHLPREASLTRLHGVGDSLVIEGAGGNASSVFDGLAEAAQLSGIVPSAPVRREVTDTGEPREWFAVTARSVSGPEPAPRAPDEPMSDSSAPRADTSTVSTDGPP